MYTRSSLRTSSCSHKLLQFSDSNDVTTFRSRFRLEATVNNSRGMLKRIVHNLVAFFFVQGIGVVSSLLLVPLYLHVWSAALYGEWLRSEERRVGKECRSRLW